MLMNFLRKASRALPDRVYISMKFRKNVGTWPNLRNPKTFNEKLQWLKLHDTDPVFTDMVDKYAVKKIITDKIGGQYVIPAYGVWDSFDEIDFDQLPDRFVLKTTHDCGGVVICDKENLDRAAVKSFLERHQKMNYFYEAREKPYKNARPKILAEAFAGEPGSTLVVYKVLCFHGEPRIIQVIQDDKTKKETIDYFDAQWNLMPFRQNYPNSPEHMPRPQKLEQMLALSKALSQDRPFIRVDWYEVAGELKFSEYTFYSDAGWAAFHPACWDEKLGSWIHLQNECKKVEG